MIAMSRRALATRSAPWAKRAAAMLAGAGVRPNAVSVGGVVFALAAFTAFAVTPAQDSPHRAALFLFAAAAVQLRLLCNLLDGMLAIEEGLKARSGELYNEIPDRLADVMILVGAGCSLAAQPIGVLLGCAAAMTALFTAYVRVLGGSLGVTQDFSGPMAKQHRMFVVTVAAVAAAIEAGAGMPARAMSVALVIVIAGAVLTACRRIIRISAEIEAR